MSSDRDNVQPIAIIGMACIFPGAANLQQYWSNIQNGVNAITEVPASRWDPVFFDPDSTAADRFYCRRGGFVDDFVDFDPLAYGIMPKAAAAADPDQLLSLRVGVEALQDAGLWTRDFNRDKTGVIIGRGNYLSAGTLRLEQHVRLVQQTLQTLQDLIPGISASQLDAVKAQIQGQLNDYGPDTAVGLIPNLVASRLANRLDLKGPAYTVDGACASALLAVEQSCQSLRRGDTDVMLTGGLHFTHDLTFWSTFCQLGALSRSDTISPLSAQADGILAGEGIGMLVLKRLSDAETDGDRIYSVIRGVASASDGRSSSLLAPAVEGQQLALQRAWQQTTLQHKDIGLIEAHGTGTPAGDKAELETLAAFFGPAEDSEQRAGLGSVKSMIGHTMPASGAAGLIKAALSVYHGVKPCTLHAEEPNKLVEQTRFRLLQKTEPWSQPRSERLAGVNAFGFGGINAHVVISGHGEQSDSVSTVSDKPPVVELLRLSANSQQALLAKLAARDWSCDNKGDRWRLAIIEPTAKRLALAKSIIEKGLAWQGRSQLYFSCEPLVTNGKTAFLFPGVDSTFDPQLADVAAHFNLPLPNYCKKLDPAKELLKVGLGLTGVNKLLNQLLQKINIQPDAMAGHSIGEWSAMAASGCLSQVLADEISAKMDPDSLQVPDVVFLAVACGLDRLTGLFEDIDELHLSHDNCPHQVIFCGRESAVLTLASRLQGKAILSQQLPIVSGFHSPLLADFAKPFTDFFTSVDLPQPTIPLWSANSAAVFPAALVDRRQVVVKHLLETVRFREMLDNMYQEGFRAFIQVGFGSLTGFVADSLKGRPHFTIAANLAKRSGMEQLCHVAAGLWAEGAEPDFAALGLPDSPIPMPAASSFRLQLGVPLLKLQQPLALTTITTAKLDTSLASTSDGESADPLEQLFRQTLVDIEQARGDIATLWQARQSSQTVTAEGFQPIKKLIHQRLDVLDNIPLVLDHAFYPQPEGWPIIADRHPVIPLTMEISLMRKAVLQTLPGLKVIRFENVKAFNWLIVEDPVDIEIEVNCTQPGVAEVSVKGYVEARAILATEYPKAPAVEPRQWQNPRQTAVNARELYDDHWMFHGPAYQSISDLGPIADNGICGHLTVSEGEGALLDNMGQLAGYWVMEQEVDCLAMPIGIESIEFFGPDPQVGEQLDCDVHIRQQDDLNCISDQQLVDGEGLLQVRIQGWQTRRFAMDKRFWIHSKQVHKYLLSESVNENFVLFDDQYETAITRDYMVKRYLNQPEIAESKTISPRRKRQWLNGRIAAKDAVRDFLWRAKGHYDFYPKELLIANNELGQPLVSAHVSDTYREQLHISIAHKDKLAVAIASEQPVGIDIELIEPRSDSFLELAMGSREIAMLQEDVVEQRSRDEIATRIWAAKEAVAKKMGTGLEGKPKAFVVEEIQGSRLRVNGHWLNSSMHNNYIICWTE